MTEPLPTLDYRPRVADRWRVPRVRIPACAALLVALSGAAGVAVSWWDRGLGSCFTIPLFVGACGYVIARVLESESPAPIKAARIILSLAALVLACALACWNESVFAYASVYDWTSGQAFGHPNCVTLAAVLALLAIVDVVEFARRKRQMRVR